MKFFPSFKLIPPVFAACDPGAEGLDLSECLTLADDSKVSDKYDSLGTVVNLLVDNLMVIAGLLLFVFVIAAGFSFLSSDKKGKEQASDIAKGAVIGFIVMFSAYWIVQIISKLTGADIRL